MDFKKLSRNLGLDEEDFIELVELFTTTAPTDIGKLRAAIETGNSQMAVEAAHSLKGASGNLGFEEFSSIAGEAERKGRSGDIGNLSGIASKLSENLERIKAHI